MPRDAKPINLTNAKYTNQNKAIRREIENRLISGGVSVGAPPLEWSEQRKSIYYRICSVLKSAGMLSGLDKYTIMQASIITDRIIQIDEMIDEKGVADKELRLCRSDYFKQYRAITSLLCLNPTALSKINALITDNQQQGQDPLIKVLKN